jgi:DNA modification methylase
LSDWKEKFLNRQVCGDNLELLKEIPNDSVHLCITSPPYNLGIDYDVYDDNKVYEKYLGFLEKRFKEVFRITVAGGKVCINVIDAGVPLHSDIIQFMTKKLKFKYLATILWNKGGRSNSPIYGTFMSPKSPCFVYPFEFVLVFTKVFNSRNVPSDKKGITMTKEEFLEATTCLWEFPAEHMMHRYDHPAMFPLELPSRLIKVLSWQDDIILDLFGGMGTTAVASKKLGRNFISMDLSQDYCDRANERIGLNQTDLSQYI